MTGQLVRLGAVAVVVAAGVQVVLTEQRAMPFDADHLEVLGIAPAAARMPGLQVGDRLARGLRRRSPGATSSSTRPGSAPPTSPVRLYARAQGALFPLDPDARWPAAHG